MRSIILFTGDLGFYLNTRTTPIERKNTNKARSQCTDHQTPLQNQLTSSLELESLKDLDMDKHGIF